MLAPLLLCLPQDFVAPPTGIRVFDAFDRDVTDRGITLVEWDGQIANPEVHLHLAPSPGTKYPVTIFVHGSMQRIQFDKEGAEDRFGLGRRINIEREGDRADFKVSIFPARTANPERDQRLWLQLFDRGKRELNRTSIPVHILDRHRLRKGPRYPIIVDFSRDKTGLFKSKQFRDIVNMAAQDWSYFLADQGEDPTPAGDELSEMWGVDGFKVSSKIQNRSTYRGFLLYVAGIDVDEWRSGGAPSPYGKPQTSGGRELPLMRSGTVNIETAGNYDRMGWFLTRGADDWWHSGNQRTEPNDLYSVAMHEIGHALGFHPRYPRFAAFKAAGQVSDLDVESYFGNKPLVNASDHLQGAIDPVSGYGCFGNEYEGTAKSRRWLISKGSLLCLQAIGYKLRSTAAFEGLSLKPMPELLKWRVGQAVPDRVTAVGGVPDYSFKVADGSLPPGVTLDSFTGALIGAPTESGDFHAKVSVADSDPTSQRIQVALHVQVSRGDTKK